MGGEQGVGHLPGQRLDAELYGEDMEGEDGDPEVEVHTGGQEALADRVEEEGEGGQADASGKHAEEEKKPDPNIDKESCHEEVGKETEKVDGHGKVVACVVLITIIWLNNILGGAIQSDVLRGEHLQEELLGEGESREVLETGYAEDEHERLIDFWTAERDPKQFLGRIKPPAPATSFTLFHRLQGILPFKEDGAFWSYCYTNEAKKGEDTSDDGDQPEVTVAQNSRHTENDEDENRSKAPTGSLGPRVRAYRHNERMDLTSICLNEATRWLGAVSAMYTLPVKKELERPARILSDKKTLIHIKSK